MPMYEYICEDCTKKFEKIRSFSQADEPIKCSHCGSMHTHRAVSKCFSKGNGDSYSVSTSGSCGGCSGGNCSHCGH